MILCKQFPWNPFPEVIFHLGSFLCHWNSLPPHSFPPRSSPVSEHTNMFVTLSYKNNHNCGFSLFVLAHNNYSFIYTSLFVCTSLINTTQLLLIATKLQTKTSLEDLSQHRPSISLWPLSTFSNKDQGLFRGKSQYLKGTEVWSALFS